MTLLFLGLCLVFGFFAVRHFMNARYVWGAFAAFGSLLMAGAVWVDFQRAAAEVDKIDAAAKAELAPAGPKIGDYQPPKADQPEGESGGTGSAE